MATSTRPRPALPPGLRLSLADRIDRRLAAIVGGSVVLHGAVAICAWLGDAPEPLVHSPFAAVTYEQDVIDISIPDLVDPVTDVGPGAATTPAKPSQAPRPIVTPSRIPSRPAAPIDSEQLASILTGVDGETGHAGSMSRRQPQRDLGAQIANARDSGAQIGDGTRTTPRAIDPRLGTTDREPIVDDPTLTRAPRSRTNEPTPRVVLGPVKPETSTTLTAATVLDRINTIYMAGLQRCYRLGLAEDATLTGRAAISFTVDERGRVTEPEASGVSRTVDTCISNQMKAWRFPIPKDANGAASDASFSVSLALQAS
jgi:hypothetical protein